MVEEESCKPYAKCRLYNICAIYNAGLLRDEFEIQMCGKGMQPDKSYVPMIPQHPNILPVEDYEIWPGGKCVAFIGYICQGYIGDLEDLLNNVNRELQGKSPKE